MTNRRKAKINQDRPCNKVDGRPPTSTKAQRQVDGDQFEALGFKVEDWNKWSYTLKPKGKFPVFRLVPGSVNSSPGWVAICDNPPLRIPIGTASAPEIKALLDRKITEIMQRNAAIADAPLVVDGQVIGPVIPF